jgi:hypothetical protein
MWRVPTIADLVADGRIEVMQSDPAAAQDLLDHATKHLQSARAILRDDPAGAYQLAYDAARKAVAADMSQNGYRVKSDRPGAHAAVVAYAAEALVGEAPPTALRDFDRMRRTRNRSEYVGVTVGHRQAEADLENAGEIVAAARRRLGATQPHA